MIFQFFINTTLIFVLLLFSCGIPVFEDVDKVKKEKIVTYGWLHKRRRKVR